VIDPQSGAAHDREFRLPIRPCREPISEMKRWALVLAIFAVAGAGLFGLSLVSAIYMAARSNQERSVDAIVVMGAAQFDGRPSAVLRARLDTTLRIWNDGVAPLIIVTGGKMPGDRFTESESSRDYLVDHGVPGTAIVLENEGRTSQTSLEHMAVIAHQRGIKSVLIVSDGFHLFRSKLIAKRNGLTAFGVPVTDGPIDRWSWLEFRYIAREAAGVTAYIFL
jgi:uncharacterized SAM-binding protein YcdF (DUF218 family)